MAGFGGTIKLEGESEYRRALTQITQSLKVVSSEMRATSTGFESGAKSQKDLATSAEQLKKALEVQKTAFTGLKSQLSAMQAEYNKTGTEHKKLVDQYTKEKAKLDEIKAKHGETSQEYKNQQKVVDELSTEVEKSTKTYEAQGKALNDMKIKTANAETTINKTTKSIDELGNEAEESGKQVKESSDGFTVMKGALANLVSSGIQSAVNGLKELGAKLVDIGKQSYSAYSQYEQLVGGVDTLFKNSSKQVQAYAQNAYKTAGISANQYMEQVTSFSATLLQGLHGDTKKAAEVADMAIRDMADNANKMGTSMTDIQNAYQGFAKDNYTMLDNLKLGYGGTQGEMARLINDSGVLGDSIKVNAKTVKDVPFDKIIEAIHKTQQEIGITGTTSKEAASTLEGSANSMKASWENLLVAIGTGDENTVKSAVNSFVEQAKVALRNSLPKIMDILKGMAELISSAWKEILPELEVTFPDLKPVIGTLQWIADNKDIIIATIAGITAGIMAWQAFSFISGIVGTIQLFVGAIQAGIPVMTALNVVMSANPIGIVVVAIAGLVTAFMALWNTSESFRNFWIGLWDGIKSIVSGVVEAIVGFFTGTIPNGIDTMVNFFSELPSKIGEFLTNAINGVAQFASNLAGKALEAGSNFLNNIIQFFNQLPEKIGFAIGYALGSVVKWGQDLYSFATTEIPKFVNSVIQFISELPSKIWTWLVNAYNNVVKWGSNMITKAIDTGTIFVSNIINFVSSLPSKLWAWLSNTINKVSNFASDMASKGAKGAKNLADNIINGIKSLPNKVMNIGNNIVKGIWEGIEGMGSWIKKKITGFADGIVKGFKSALKIHSPSKVFSDEVGKYMAQGIGVGFGNEMKNVNADMQNAISTDFDFGKVSVTGSTFGSYRENLFNSLVSAFKQALSEMKIELDDEEMGKFVDRTVTKAIYQ